MIKNTTRGTRTALVCAGFHVAFMVVMWIVASWAHSLAARACALMLTEGVALWLMSGLLFYARQLADREKHELTALAESSSASIFEGDTLAHQEVAKHRLENITRWVVPIFTLAWALINGILGWRMLKSIPARATIDIVDAAPAAMFVVVVGFGAFLLSFYALGMAREERYRALRAPGSFLFVTVLMMLGTLVSLVGAWQGLIGIDHIVAWIVPVVMLVLAVEMLVGLVLNLYRPRMPGAEVRLSYDSRLMNLIAEPQQIGRSIAETLNYQFGFAISQTWFYQLLQKALVPLLLFAVAILIGISSFVIVPEGEQAVITHFGRIDGPVRHAGMHLKWPWPIGRAMRFDGRVRTLTVGTGQDRDHHGNIIAAGTFKGRELALWTAEHGHAEERNFLLAVPPRGNDQKLPSVDIIKLVVEVQYQVVDPVKFGYEFENGDEILRCLAEREMVRYCSSATLLESANPVAGRPEAIMTTGREAMRNTFRDRITAIIEAEPFDLGVKIVAVNVKAVHPPAEAAKSFEEVLAAQLSQRTQLHLADAWARQEFIRAAGNVRLGQELALALRRQEDFSLLVNLRSAGNTTEFDRALDQAVRLLDSSLEKARSEMLRRTLLGADDLENDSRRFFDLMAAYRDELKVVQEASPDKVAALVMGGAQQAQADVARLFAEVGGRSAVYLADADAVRWELEMTERARASTFPAETDAWQANKTLYELDRYLAAWDSVLPGVTKYVVCIDPDRVEMRINLERSGRVEDRLTFEDLGGE